jgi:dTDP-4-dehydrorhamnose reductase
MLKYFDHQKFFVPDKILIVGVSGLLGGKLYQIGKERYQMFGTYLTHQVSLERSFRLDATRRQDVFTLIGKIRPDLVIDTHSITNVDYCETHPEEAWRVNVEGTKNVAEACKTFGSKLIFLSSEYVFDGRKSSYSEKDKPRPLNYYGKTKLIGERVIEALDVNHIIARTAVLYGRGGAGKRPFIMWVLENLRAGKEINIVIDQFNNPTLADNLAEILLKLYEKDAVGLFHTVGRDNVSRYELAQRVTEIWGLDRNLIKPITTPELRQAAPRPRKLELSTHKLQRLLGVVPVGIEEGLKIVKEQMRR